MNTAKITISDNLSLREDLNSSWQLLQKESSPVTAEISQRLKDTEGRIGATTDLAVLQRLYTFEKFLKKLTAQWDTYNLFIARMIERFSALDDAFWNGALKGHHLEEENRNLKAEVEALKIRCGIIQDGLRSAVINRGINAADMDMITNSFHREQHDHG